MAIWQYTFELIPKEDIESLGLSNHIELEAYNNTTFWGKSEYGINFFKPLTDILERHESWSNNILLYGADDGNCIKLIIQYLKVTEVTIRIDYRSDYSVLLNNTLEFCRTNSLLLLGEDLKIPPLNATNIDYLIRSSKQYIKLRDMLNEGI